jgi:serine/threonine-protein kinase
MKIIIGPIPLPSQHGSVPDGFDRWWVKATAREPAERFQSAKDFADSLGLVCGVSQVSGIIDRPNLRVVAHQTAGGQGALPTASNIAPGTIADPSLPPTSPPLHATRQGAPPQATPHPTPPAQMFQASVTPATFGESVVTPKKTNVGIFVGVGAAILVTLVTGVVLFVVKLRAPIAAGGHPADSATAASSEPGPSQPAPSQTVAVAPVATEAASAGASAVAPTPNPPASVAVAPTFQPDPVPPPTSVAVDTKPPPQQRPVADPGAAVKPPPSHPTSTGHAPPSTVKKPKHDDLGI